MWHIGCLYRVAISFIENTANPFPRSCHPPNPFVCVRPESRLPVLYCCFYRYSLLHRHFAQVIAGIRANGQIVNKGDTVRVCEGNAIIYQSAALGSFNISWQFTGSELNLTQPASVPLF